MAVRCRLRVRGSVFRAQPRLPGSPCGDTIGPCRNDGENRSLQARVFAGEWLHSKRRVLVLSWRSALLSISVVFDTDFIGHPCRRFAGRQTSFSDLPVWQCSSTGASGTAALSTANANIRSTTGTGRKRLSATDNETPIRMLAFVRRVGCRSECGSTKTHRKQRPG